MCFLFSQTRNHACVCRSGLVPDDGHGWVVLVVVDSHDEHGGVGAGGGDHHLLGTALEVSLWDGVRVHSGHTSQWSHVKVFCDAVAYTTQP